MLNLQGLRVVVIGAGPTGMRKVHSLLRAGAKVTVVDPKPPAGGIKIPGEVEIIADEYRSDQLAGARLVFACTGDRGLNSRISSDARRAGALVNSADQPEECDFYCPAVFQDGDVVVAVGTGGQSAGLAVFLRDRLAGAMPANIGKFARRLGTIRKSIRSRIDNPHQRAKVMKTLAGRQGHDAFAKDGPAGLDRLAEQLLSGVADEDPLHRDKS